jgi:hypothetical protein
MPTIVKSSPHNRNSFILLDLNRIFASLFRFTFLFAIQSSRKNH